MSTRNSDGTFKRGVSGNAKGRPVGSKGKHTKQKLENQLNDYGQKSFKALFELAEEARQKQEVNTAVKIYTFLAGKWFEIVVHNERVSIQQEKDAARLKSLEESVEEDNDLEGRVVQITFGSAANNG
jgi:hypothetical protein